MARLLIEIEFFESTWRNEYQEFLFRMIIDMRLKIKSRMFLGLI